MPACIRIDARTHQHARTHTHTHTHINAASPILLIRSLVLSRYQVSWRRSDADGKSCQSCTGVQGVREVFRSTVAPCLGHRGRRPNWFCETRPLNWMDEIIGGWVDFWWMNGSWMDGWMDGWMDHGWPDGWTEGWMDGGGITMITFEKRAWPLDLKWPPFDAPLTL